MELLVGNDGAEPPIVVPPGVTVCCCGCSCDGAANGTTVTPGSVDCNSVCNSCCSPTHRCKQIGKCSVLANIFFIINITRTCRRESHISMLYHHCTLTSIYIKVCLKWNIKTPPSPNIAGPEKPIGCCIISVCALLMLLVVDSMPAIDLRLSPLPAAGSVGSIEIDHQVRFQDPQNFLVE